MIYHTIIIGAGQAGLSTGYYLQKQTLPFLILEAANTIGASWSSRYDSLRLFTPARFSSLPGLDFPLPAKSLPTKNQMTEYLKEYAAHHQLPVKTNQSVVSLSRPDQDFKIVTQSKEFFSKNVVVATGPHRMPNVPGLPKVNPQVKMIHSSEYKNPGQIPLGPVLVVGGANSAADIATELSATHKVWLSHRSRLKFSALYYLDYNVVWWSHKLGVMYINSNSWAGRRLKAAGEPIFGKKLQHAIDNGKIKKVPEIVKVHQRQVFFKDGTSHEFTTLIWATGYTNDYSWIGIKELFNKSQEPEQKQGVSAVPGLYFMGLEWQRSRSSALIAGAGRDARYITDHILKRTMF